jgi:hypothetical protein
MIQKAVGSCDDYAAFVHQFFNIRQESENFERKKTATTYAQGTDPGTLFLPCSEYTLTKS